MSVLTKALLDDMYDKIMNTVYEQPKLWVSSSAWDDLLKWQKWETWVISLGPRKEKQERLRVRLKGNCRYVNKLPLPN